MLPHAVCSVKVDWRGMRHRVALCCSSTVPSADQHVARGKDLLAGFSLHCYIVKLIFPVPSPPTIWDCVFGINLHGIPVLSSFLLLNKEWFDLSMNLYLLLQGFTEDKATHTHFLGEHPAVIYHHKLSIESLQVLDRIWADILNWCSLRHLKLQKCILSPIHIFPIWHSKATE